MTREQLMTDLQKWIGIGPEIMKMANELLLYRQYGKTPAELDRNIRDIRDEFLGQIAARDRQIQELLTAVQQLQADPLGIDRANWSRSRKANTTIQ